MFSGKKVFSEIKSPLAMMNLKENISLDGLSYSDKQSSKLLISRTILTYLASGPVQLLLQPVSLLPVIEATQLLLHVVREILTAQEVYRDNKE